MQVFGSDILHIGDLINISLKELLELNLLKEAQKGVMFAAYLKLLMPLVIVLPGICAAMLFPVLDKTDQAYPTMMIELLPSGLLGLTFAALIAAIVSSLASMTNSISTIFTMDICRSFFKKEIQQQSLILIGRSAVVGSYVIALVMAKPILGNSDQIFQYIQNFTGLFTPGILVIFLVVALFWKKATTLSVLVAAILSVVMSIFIQASFQISHTFTEWVLFSLLREWDAT